MSMEKKAPLASLLEGSAKSTKLNKPTKVANSTKSAKLDNPDNKVEQPEKNEPAKRIKAAKKASTAVAPKVKTSATEGAAVKKFMLTLPSDLHMKVKLESIQTDTDMNDIIVAAIQDRLGA